MKTASKLFLYYLPPVLWMGLIFFLSSFHKLQASPVGWQDFIFRKTAHFLEYAVLAILFYRGLRNTTKFPDKNNLALCFLLTVLYALSDELHQTRVYGRTGRSFDIGVDSLGAFFGMLFVWKLADRLPRKAKDLLGKAGL